MQQPPHQTVHAVLRVLLRKNPANPERRRVPLSLFRYPSNDHHFVYEATCRFTCVTACTLRDHHRANRGGLLGFSTQIPRLTTTEKHGILKRVALEFLSFIPGVRRGSGLFCRWQQRMASSGIRRREESGIGDIGEIQGRHPAGRHVIEEQCHGTEDLRSRRLAVNMN